MVIKIEDNMMSNDSNQQTFKLLIISEYQNDKLLNYQLFQITNYLITNYVTKLEEQIIELSIILEY